MFRASFRENSHKPHSATPLKTRPSSNPHELLCGTETVQVCRGMEVGPRPGVGQFHVPILLGSPCEFVSSADHQTNFGMLTVPNVIRISCKTFAVDSQRQMLPLSGWSPHSLVSSAHRKWVENVWMCAWVPVWVPCQLLLPTATD